MLITTAKVAIKVGRSKAARKAARKAVEFARENVTVDTEARALDIEVGGKVLRVDRNTFKRNRNAESVPAIESPFPESDPFL